MEKTDLENVKNWSCLTFSCYSLKIPIPLSEKCILFKNWIL